MTKHYLFLTLLFASAVLSAQPFETIKLLDNEVMLQSCVHDFNGDGYDDIMASSPEVLYLFLNKGQSPIAFTKLKINQVSGWYTELKKIDYDQDGDMDVVCNSEGKISYLNNKSANGQLNFELLSLPFLDTTKASDFPGPDDWLYHFDVNDYNGDGLLDVVSCVYSQVNFSKSSFTLFTKKEAGLNGESVALDLVQNGIKEVNRVAFADLDGKLPMEIVVANEDSDILPLEYFILIDGKWQRKTIEDSPTYGIRDFAIHDFTNDGKKDIVSARGDGFVFLFVNTSTPTAISFERKFLYVEQSKTASFDLLDFNKDGLMDIADTYNGSFAPKGASIMINKGGNFPTFESIEMSKTRNSFSLSHGDFDKDGDYDFALPCVDGAGLHMIQNNSPISGNNDIIIDGSVTAFPNPTSDIINVKSDNQILSIQLYDEVGKLIKTIKDINKNSITISLVELTSSSKIMMNVTTDKGVASKLLLRSN